MAIFPEFNNEKTLADFIYEVQNFADAKEKAAILFPMLHRKAKHPFAIEIIETMRELEDIRDKRSITPRERDSLESAINYLRQDARDLDKSSVNLAAIDQLREALLDVTAHLAGALSLCETRWVRNENYSIRLNDFRNSLERARKALEWKK